MAERVTWASPIQGDGEGQPVRVLIAGDETGGRFALLEVRERGGAGPPRHRHEWEDEVVYVVEGGMTFLRDGERLFAQAGSCVLLPRGRDHTYRVDSDGARLLVALAPAGFEAAYGEVAWGGSQASVERLVCVAARHGVEVTGPPLGP